jgi:hypothetical protein
VNWKLKIFTKFEDIQYELKNSDKYDSSEYKISLGRILWLATLMYQLCKKVFSNTRSLKSTGKKLYSDETSLKQQDAVKMFVFKQHFGDDGILDWNDMADDYDPLIF